MTDQVYKINMEHYSKVIMNILTKHSITIWFTDRESIEITGEIEDLVCLLETINYAAKCELDKVKNDYESLMATVSGKSKPGDWNEVPI